MQRRLSAHMAWLLAATALATPSLASAQTSAREAALEARLERLEAEMSSLRSDLAAARNDQAATAATAEQAKAKSSEPDLIDQLIELGGIFGFEHGNDIILTADRMDGLHLGEPSKRCLDLTMRARQRLEHHVRTDTAGGKGLPKTHRIARDHLFLFEPREP